MYYFVLKTYSELEVIIEKHSKKLHEANISLKNYLRTSSEIHFRRFLTLIDQLRADRKIIVNIAKKISQIKLDSMSQEDLKQILETLDYIHALLDYHRLVDLDEEFKLLSYAIENSENSTLSYYVETFEKDISEVRKNVAEIDDCLKSLKTLITTTLKKISDEKFISNYVKNLSFKLS